MNNDWLYGPEFIRKQHILEFDYNNDSIETEEKHHSLSITEEHIKQKTIEMILSVYFQDLQTKPRLENIIDISRFSDFHKLPKVTAYVFRFANRLSVDTTLTSEEIENSKIRWIASEQRREAREIREIF